MIKIDPSLIADISLACYILASLITLLVPEYVERGDIMVIQNSKTFVHYDKNHFYKLSKTPDGEQLLEGLMECPDLINMLRLDRWYDKLKPILTNIHFAAGALYIISASYIAIYFVSTGTAIVSLGVMFISIYCVSKLINWYILYYWFYMSFPRIHQICVVSRLYDGIMSKEMSNEDRELLSLILIRLKEGVGE